MVGKLRSHMPCGKKKKRRRRSYSNNEVESEARTWLCQAQNERLRTENLLPRQEGATEDV